MKHQKDTRNREDDEEQTGDSAQAERVRESKAVAFYLRREDMEEEVVIDEHGTLQIRIGDSGSENGTPYGRIENASNHPLPHLSPSLYKVDSRWYSSIVIVPVGHRLTHNPH